MASSSSNLEHLLVAQGIDPSVARSCVNALLSDQDDFEPLRSDDREEKSLRDGGLTLPTWNYVIRDDDVGLLAAIVEASLAALGLGALQATPETGMLSIIAATVVASFKLLSNLSKKGAFLNPLQSKVVTALKTLGQPAAIGDISRILNSDPAFVRHAVEFSCEEVESELRKLTQVRLRDGSVVAIAAIDADGLWGSCGV